jgi:iron complex transport system substrate-binding protein
LDYAEGFDIYYYKDYKEVEVYNPWIKNTVLARYYLVNNKLIKTPGEGIKIKIPIQSIAITSVTQTGFLEMINELKTVKGVSSPHLFYNKIIAENIKAGNITDLGEAFSLNLEKTLQLKPDIVMMSGYNQNDPYAQRVQNAGVPVVYNNEWMESSLLARAEWIKFVAAFYDKEAFADSIFNVINENYIVAKQKAQKVKNKPKVMSGSNYRGTWYVPAGKNFIARLYADAGGNYFYENDSSKGSLPLNFETAVKNFASTDVWLSCSYNSIDELLKADSKHNLFRPVKLGKVYNFNKKMLPTGANDFWESAVVRPDILLKDVISVLHPEILPDYEPVYIDRLN